MAFEKLRAQIQGLGPEAFDAVAQEVDRRRGDSDGKFEDKHFRALSLLSDKDLANAYRRDPALIGRVQEGIEKYQSRKELEQPITFKIVPYRVKDPSIAQIILKGPDALYAEWERAMVKRAAQRGPDEFVRRAQSWIEAVAIEAVAIEATANRERSERDDDTDEGSRDRDDVGSEAGTRSPAL